MTTVTHPGARPIFDPDDAAVRGNPWPVYDRLRREAPVYKVPGRDMYVLSRYADVVRVLRDYEAFSSRRSNVPVIIIMDPPDHTRMRKMVGPEFTPRAVESLRPAVRDLADRLIDGFIDRGGCEFMESFAYPLPVQVIASMLGAPLERAEELRAWTEDVTRLGWEENNRRSPFRPPISEETEERARASLFAFYDYLSAVIRDHEARPRDDLTMKLIRLRDAGQLTAEELLLFIRMIFVAGHATTVQLLGNGTRILAQRPEVWSELKADPSLLPGFVEEVLRYESSIQRDIRAATRDVEMHGVTIPAGAAVMLLLGAANRDPDRFPDPDVFDLRRDNRDHVGFGIGIHLCLGAPLSRLEGVVAWGALLRRLKSLRLAPGFDPEAAQITALGMGLRGHTHLPIIFESE